MVQKGQIWNSCIVNIEWLNPYVSQNGYKNLDLLREKNVDELTVVSNTDPYPELIRYIRNYARALNVSVLKLEYQEGAELPVRVTIDKIIERTNFLAGCMPRLHLIEDNFPFIFDGETRELLLMVPALKLKRA